MRGSRSMRAVALAMVLCRAKALAPAAPLGATSRGAALRATVETATTAAPPTTDLVAKTRAFLESGTGFYSAPDASMLADDFIFRGGVVGPLNKADYLDTMEKLGVYRAFDLDANAYGFVEDPRDPRCVRFFLRNTGEHVDAWQPQFQSGAGWSSDDACFANLHRDARIRDDGRDDAAAWRERGPRLRSVEQAEDLLAAMDDMRRY